MKISGALHAEEETFTHRHGGGRARSRTRSPFSCFQLQLLIARAVPISALPCLENHVSHQGTKILSRFESAVHCLFQKLLEAVPSKKKKKTCSFFADSRAGSATSPAAPSEVRLCPLLWCGITTLPTYLVPRSLSMILQPMRRRTEHSGN